MTEDREREEKKQQSKKRISEQPKTEHSRQLRRCFPISSGIRQN